MLFHQELRELAAIKNELQPEIDELAAEIKRLQALKKDREAQIAAIEEPLRQQYADAYTKRLHTGTWQAHPLVSVYQQYHAEYDDKNLALHLIDQGFLDLVDLKVRRADFQKRFRDDEMMHDILPADDGFVVVVRIDKLEAVLYMDEEV